MNVHLRSELHFFNMSKSLFEDEIFSDIIYVTDSVWMYGHSSLIFHQIPSLEDVVCDKFKQGHDQLHIFLPDVKAETLETALLQLYLKGDAEYLKDILEVQKVDVKEENHNEADDTLTDENFENKYVSVIKYHAPL